MGETYGFGAGAARGGAAALASDVGRRGDRKNGEGEDGESAVLLVLLEAATQVLLGDAIAAHALAGIVDLVQDILGGNVAGADDADADGDGGAVATEPPPRGGYHD